MIRKMFVMSVDKGKEAEYRERHNPIWPDLEQTLIDHGVHNYSIFLDAETNNLLAYVEIEDQALWDAIAETEICQKWWARMIDVMPSNADNSPVSRETEEVFHLD